MQRGQRSGLYADPLVVFATRCTMDEILRAFQMDKETFQVTSLTDEPDDRAYWASKTPQERLAALEYLRVIHYGYDPTTERLQRVFTISRLGEG